MQSKASERLSSGYKINRASDDAAGLAISEKMRGQIRGLTQASKNVDDAISLIKTAEGGMQGVDDMLHRIRELIDFGANDTNEFNNMSTDDRQKIQDEIGQLVEEIDNMSQRIEYNKKKLIDGSFQDTELRLNDATNLVEKLGIEQNSAAAKDSALAKALDAAQVNLDDMQKIYDQQVSGDPTLLPAATIRLTGARSDYEAAAKLLTIAQNNVSNKNSIKLAAAEDLGNARNAYSKAKTDLATHVAELKLRYGGGTTPTAMNNVDVDDFSTFTAGNISDVMKAAVTAGDVTAEQASIDADKLINLVTELDKAAVKYGVDDTGTAGDGLFTNKTTLDALQGTFAASGGGIAIAVSAAAISITSTGASGNIRVSEDAARTAVGATGTTAAVGLFDELVKAEVAYTDALADLPALETAFESAKTELTAAQNQMSTANSGIYAGAVVEYQTAETDYTILNSTYENAKTTALNAMSQAGLNVTDINNWTKSQLDAIDTVKMAELKTAIQNYDKAAAALGLDELKVATLSADAKTAFGTPNPTTGAIVAFTPTSVASGVGQNVVHSRAEAVDKSNDGAGGLDGRFGGIKAWDEAKKVFAEAEGVYQTAVSNKEMAQEAYDRVEKERAVASAELRNVTTRYTAATVSRDAAKELDDANNSKPLHFQVGANGGQSLLLSIGSIKSDMLGIGDGKGNTNIDVMKATGADITATIDVLDQALSYVTTERSRLGAAVNRMEYTQQSLDITNENLSDAESRIRDADLAQEQMNKVKADTLQQVTVAMMAQANQAPQAILQLLR